MARHLREIVEEGFLKLSQLSSRRTEILERFESGAITGDSGGCAEQILKDAELSLTQEFQDRVEQSRELLKQNLAQFAEDSDRTVSSLQHNLYLTVIQIEKELSQFHDPALVSAWQRMDSLVIPLESEIVSSLNQLSLEAEKLMADLHHYCKTCQMELHLEFLNQVGKLSKCRREFETVMAEQFAVNETELERNREKAMALVQSLYGAACDSVKELAELIESGAGSAAAESSSIISAERSKIEGMFKKTHDKILSRSSSEIRELSQELLSEIQDNHEYNTSELTKILADLQAQSEQWLEQGSAAYASMNLSARARADLVPETDSHLSGELLEVVGDDDLMAMLAQEMNSFMPAFNQKLQDLLGTHNQRLSATCAKVEERWADLNLSLSARHQELVMQQQERWQEKEQALLARIKPLEKEIQQTLLNLSEPE